MHSTWWGWEEGSRCFFLRWSKEFWSVIRDGKRKWQVGPQPRFIQPHRSEKGEDEADKESINLKRCGVGGTSWKYYLITSIIISKCQRGKTYWWCITVLQVYSMRPYGHLILHCLLSDPHSGRCRGEPTWPMKTLGNFPRFYVELGSHNII